jgi:hypothetical protein
MALLSQDEISEVIAGRTFESEEHIILDSMEESDSVLGESKSSIRSLFIIRNISINM